MLYNLGFLTVYTRLWDWPKPGAKPEQGNRRGFATRPASSPCDGALARESLRRQHAAFLYLAEQLRKQSTLSTALVKYTSLPTGLRADALAMTVAANAQAAVSEHSKPGKLNGVEYGLSMSQLAHRVGAMQMPTSLLECNQAVLA